ncbi:RING1 and YY1-binding protein [Ailuropoda melanoleuca]|uniref:RING1 and YY1-binding protein n=1 Tax=Ailuropoda melanoleuca TaxID=9646 RepID=UPI001494293B|nr:RING1 and YY1-binding protein [Ailuropoda melanoleuca]
MTVSAGGLGGGLGLECRQEARTSGEVDTKLRVAEEQRGAGEPGPKERPCRLPGYYKPRGVANGAAVASPSGARKLRGTTFPGAASGSGSPRQPLKASARMRTPLPLPGRGHVRPAGIARSAAPGRRATGKHAVSLPLGAGGRARRNHGGSSSAALRRRRRHSSQTKGDLTRPKRQAKPAADEGFWDCSVCTFRNSAEAFKCSICDVRKGTSTRKPRINSQLVAQQVAQQYATPPPPKKEKKEKVEKQDKEKPEKDKEISPSVTKKNTNKKTKPKSDILKDPPSEANSIQSANATTKTSETNHTSRPRLKNVDRSTAQQLAVTVGNVTVIITDFKEKTRSSSTSSSTVTSSAGSEQQNQSSSGSESTDKGSSRSSTPKGDMSAVNDESF